MAELERKEQIGKMWLWISIVYNAIGVVIIVALMMHASIEKDSLIKDAALTP